MIGNLKYLFILAVAVAIWWIRRQANKAAGGSGAADETAEDKAAWSCPQCGESVPTTFDKCWKCDSANSGRPSNADSPA